MKYLRVLLVGLLLFTLGCNSTVVDPVSDEEQLAIDLALIDNWLADNGIADVIQHPQTGIRYTVNKKGTGSRAQVADKILVGYEGRFLDTEEVFDTNTSWLVVLNSGNFILGWYYMIQEMDEGDEFTIYIPSKYAYGTTGNVNIPPNTVLVFDITLIKTGF